MTTKTMPEHHKLRLQAHFGFTRVPFCKNLWPTEMFDSRSQRDLCQGLRLWTEVKGLSLVTGDTGVGKSSTIRRFVGSLDDARFRVVHLSAVPATANGFLRAVSRVLALPMRAYTADLFDQAQKHLTAKAVDDAPHPLLVIDNAEGLSVEILDLVRRLTAHGLDAEDRFSVVLAGTDDLLRTLRDPSLDPLRSRFSYVQPLRPFSNEDARNYITFHVKRAGVRADLFTEDAVRRVFHASGGRPRAINQLAIQSLIQAAVEGRDQIDGDFAAAQISAHPLYERTVGRAS
ncbi:MAG: AAA family ATPase [Deltaproteobacteria bacterium]|nr:AAA family ATPase [Deltaproteobacteria bacterium]